MCFDLCYLKKRLLLLPLKIKELLDISKIRDRKNEYSSFLPIEQYLIMHHESVHD